MAKQVGTSTQGDSPDTDKQGSLATSAFAQQRISSWQPILAPSWIIILLSLLGLGIVALGTVFLLASSSIVECEVAYEDPPNGCMVPCDQIFSIRTKDCSGSLKTNSDGVRYIEPPVYLYYKLTKFYQNHRRYLKSRNLDQLYGKVILDTDKLADCEPALLTTDGFQILTPCGLAPRSVFNDTLTPLKDEVSGEVYPLAETLDDIAPFAKKNKFKNPPEDAPGIEKLNQWLPEDIFPGKMENSHFIVWMRDAALPNFRKLYGIIKEEVAMPFHVNVKNRYPVSAFGGTKSIIISTTSWMGGRNSFLGIVFITVGSLQFCVGLFMAIRNRRNPRILGDVRFLRWTGRPKNH